MKKEEIRKLNIYGLEQLVTEHSQDITKILLKMLRDLSYYNSLTNISSPLTSTLEDTIRRLESLIILLQVHYWEIQKASR